MIDDFLSGGESEGEAVAAAVVLVLLSWPGQRLCGFKTYLVRRSTKTEIQGSSIGAT